MNKIRKAFRSIYTSLYLIVFFATNNALAYRTSYSSNNNPFTMLLLIFLFYAMVICVWIVVAYWGCKDANKRGQNGLLWGIVIFFGGLLGLLVYIALRNNFKTDTPKRICTNGGRSIPFDANICPYCAKKFEIYY
jgi:hypothetical protein